MPCYPQRRKKFEILKEEVRQAQSHGTATFTQREEWRRRTELLYDEVKKKIEDHEKELALLLAKLRAATSEEEKARLKRLIDELEAELEEYKDMLQQLVEFMRDLERRTISAPAQHDPKHKEDGE
jgi:multidrug resistance efflux pump